MNRQVTRCPECGRQRQTQYKWRGRGFIWIEPVLGAESLKERGYQIEWRLCDECRGSKEV